MIRRAAGMLALGGLLVLAPACKSSSVTEEIQEFDAPPRRDDRLFRDNSGDFFRMGGAGLRPKPPTVREFGSTVPEQPAPMTGNNPYLPETAQPGIGGTGNGAAGQPAETPATGAAGPTTPPAKGR